jgi:glycosyltransferase involved in cell wall biosynthesis
VGKVYYLVPDLFVPNLNPIKILSNIKKKGLRKGLASIFPKHKPVGGTKVTYQHCMLLREMGIDASIVLMGKYKGNFFGYDTQYLTKKQALSKISSEDIVVGTEFRPFEALCFDKAKKVLFFQNPANISRVLKKEGPKKNYLELGYDYVITCGDLCTEVLKNEMGIDATTITNGVDQSIFKPAKETKIVGRVLVMSRKNFQDFEKIRNICSKKLDVDFHIVDGLTQEQLIKEYQKSDIFLATGYPEGFGLPPLEAMLCGCAVVGFTGGAAGEYMIDEDTALVADDGDCETAADKLLHILTDENLKESIRKNGTAKAKEYSLERTSYLLRQFYKDVIE